MKWLKPYIKTIHLWLGLASGLVVFIMALSGSILVFEKELGPFFDPPYYKVPQIASRKLPADILTEEARSRHPGSVLTNLYIFDDPGRSILIHLTDKDGQRLVISADPYSGAILKDTFYKKRFFTIVTELHRYLLMGDTGKAITGISCLVFVVLLISGIILWWPLRLKNLKQRLTIKWNASFKRLNWDLHSVFGFYSALFLLITALTGLIWSYDWYENLMYYLADGASKPVHLVKNRATKSTESKKEFFYESMLKETDSLFSYKGDIRLIVPGGDRSILVLKESLEAGIPNVRDMAYFDMHSGQRLKTTLYRELSTGDKIRRLVYPVHIGSIYGYPTKILAFLICLVAASSPVTGFLIWKGRKKKAKNNRYRAHSKRRKTKHGPLLQKQQV
ncbi:PepSY-associated TM helix domain-containing protein [Sinomicrobium soli]|uniref:PepSY-associated TM helix domain-containing protein n=1 Tax=Sinomicrobium sp. N-1-3-6 TaxID=2219864 RepID=UPI000DCCE601|nr:PepSY-associated TM helix domain-containing protein [Sinomicrobium sp. N-1-3-6]RAV29729.1 PepSY domain-containing protein [Sinomicrobium sp. N-1-3-6]